MSSTGMPQRRYSSAIDITNGRQAVTILAPAALSPARQRWVSSRSVSRSSGATSATLDRYALREPFWSGSMGVSLRPDTPLRLHLKCHARSCEDFATLRRRPRNDAPSRGPSPQVFRDPFQSGMTPAEKRSPGRRDAKGIELTPLLAPWRLGDSLPS